MNASSNSKSSSSDDDLLESELSDATRKKHFLDYDYDDQSPPTRNSSTNDSHGANINAPLHSIGSISNDNGNLINIQNGTTSINNNKSAQLVDSKKKINERPSTSKMTTIDQINTNTKESNLANNGESVYSILTMLGNVNSADISSKFLECSKNREMCATLRLSGCMSLLVQMIHSESSTEKQQKECLQALHNIIYCHPDDKAGRREARAIKLIEQLLDYCDSLILIMKNELSDNVDRFPIQAIGTLMKISFDEEHRYALGQLGALQTISKLIQLDHAVHGPLSTDTNCITMRRYAGMCLTNLTFGDGNNKALLCSNKKFMRALVDQINSGSDELVPVSASIIRNLSWRADANMKEVLNEINTVKILTVAAMKCSQENTLKAILSALWNLSNHCAKNKADFCEIEGAIAFLVDMLSYDAASKTTSVIENAGGILRNVSTHIAEHEKFRAFLRTKNCLSILLRQLKSPSLTVVSNACGTLGNLSAHCAEDQDFLRENGAIPMLRSLIYSKHKMISTGSTIALRHLLAYKSSLTHNENLDSVAKMMDLKELPTLNARKQRALEHELSFSCDANKIDTSPPTKDDKTKDFGENSKDKINRTNELKVQNIEDDEEDAPTNFCKFDDDQEVERSEYQETNLDQITDYSIRYSENQSDFEEIPPKPPVVTIAEDTMKCYNTEGTPQAILSKAGSLSDLQKKRLMEIDESVEAEETKAKNKFSANASGLQSPEKTINYCVEGTPAIFSRSDSFSDLDESSMLGATLDKSEQGKAPMSSKIPPPLLIRKDFPLDKDSSAPTPKSVTFRNLAEETPLMFSRTSSMGSLDSAEPGYVDDKSSVLSDFSRLASGIISPSELPDSPSQSVPQSPSRLFPRNQQRNIGVSKTSQIPVTRGTIEATTADDSLNAFHVENTPAAFSYATSLSNLSFDDEPKISTDAISKNFELMKHPSCEDDDQSLRKTPVHDNAEKSTPVVDQSDAESIDDDILLKKCINMGMNRVAKSANDEDTRAGSSDNCSNTPAGRSPGSFSREETQKFSAKAVQENPLDMMRTRASLLPPYFPIVDELNKFIVEDSPCNLSLMSGLSAITIESNFNPSYQINKPKAKVEPTNGASSTSRTPAEEITPQKQDFDDSLSSLSIESEDDLLTQTIAAGSKPIKSSGSSYPINIPSKPGASNVLGNESISSVDSCTKDDTSNLILEQCIRSGINKVVKKDSAKSRERAPETSSPKTKKSMLPTFNIKPGPSKSINVDKKVQDKKDEQLLQETITSGILKSIHSNDKHLVHNLAQLSISDPKNAETTSVIAKECVSTITGVEAKIGETIPSQMKKQKTDFNSLMIESHDHEENIDSRSEHFHQETWMMPNGSNSNIFDLNFSLGSTDDNILERSNEYPAAKLSIYGDFDDDSIMDVSNEFMVENEKLTDVKIEDKHKDPDLMLKSVDRLTQELVSTAEYLRKNATSTFSDEISVEQKMSNSLSNTWNDENSFPSISLSAPMIGSTNDETTFATDQINPIPEEKVSVETTNQLDDKTPTNENYMFSVKKDEDSELWPKIEFKVGGEIGAASLNKINFLSFGPTSIETNSTMSNSTIVQVEARRIANKFTSMNNCLMDSTASLDLEKVRPPSSMDCISLNSHQESSIQQSPSRQPKKLMTGLIAKRALSNQMFSTSAESINSIHNIDSIRPPSIMDELLDSMISVDSIVSEIFEPTIAGISNYETAMSDTEESSLTLRSCQDLSKDETLTPVSSDFSSVDITPKKKRSPRSSTPKQKRQSDKDRYKTYTIQVDLLLKEQQQQQKRENSGAHSLRRSLNARERRREDRQRFETQVISGSPSRDAGILKTESGIFNDFDDDFSIRAMTENFKFLHNGSTHINNTVDTARIITKLNRIKSGGSSSVRTDESLEFERQNSETESQRDLKNSTNNDSSSLTEHDLSTISPEATPQLEPQKLKPTKSSYISPYRMTTRITPMKNKTVKVSKTPIITKIVTKKPGFDIKSSQNMTQRVTVKTNTSYSRANAAAKFPVAKTNIPKPATTPTHHKEPPALPIRQGTFIKEEPTLENVPVVNDSSASPAKTSVSKLKQPTRVTSSLKMTTNSVERNSSPKKSFNLHNSASTTQLKYRSISNASMKTPVSAPIRSNTGINLNNPKKSVTSKIAGIWKSGDKKESLLKKPISTSTTQLNCGSKLTTATELIGRKVASNMGKDRIKRSSTCDEIV